MSKDNAHTANQQKASLQMPTEADLKDAERMLEQINEAIQITHRRRFETLADDVRSLISDWAFAVKGQIEMVECECARLAEASKGGLPDVALSDDPAISAWGKYNYFLCAEKGQHDMRLAFLAGYRVALKEGNR